MSKSGSWQLLVINETTGEEWSDYFISFNDVIPAFMNWKLRIARYARAGEDWVIQVLNNGVIDRSVRIGREQ